MSILQAAAFAQHPKLAWSMYRRSMYMYAGVHAHNAIPFYLGPVGQRAMPGGIQIGPRGDKRRRQEPRVLVLFGQANVQRSRACACSEEEKRVIRSVHKY